MGRALNIGFVSDQFLDSEQDLLDGDAALPVLLFVQNAQANCAGGVDIWVREEGLELALWGSQGVICWEFHVE